MTAQRTHSNIDFEKIDAKICAEIDILTSENSNIWTSPEYNRREYVHSFFQYPAMMVPVVQKKIIEVLVSHCPNIQNMLDPFMGSGTSLVASMENGLNCFGQDINPLAILVSKTRTGPFYVNAIEEKKEELFKRIEKDRSDKVAVYFKGLDKWFQENVSIELSRIVRAIENEERLSIRRFFWVLLAETVRLTSNDRTSTFKLHMRTAADIKSRKISPIEFFRKHFDKCLEDVRQYSEILSDANKLSKGAYTGEVCISLLDSKKRVFTPNRGQNFFDLVVTSPPYGDNKTTVTYGQHAYLPLQWINLNDIDSSVDEDVLKSTLEIDSRGLGGKLADLTEEELKKIFSASPSLEIIYNKVLSKDPQKVKKIVTFFYDLYSAIENIDKTIKDNGYQIWTVGNRTVADLEIPNEKIIEEFILYKNSKLVKKLNREILNKRMAKRNNQTSLMNNESILIFRKHLGTIS